MMISTKGRYALRVMLDMAEHGGSEWHRLSDVAQRQQLSKKYLETIMAALSRANLVESAVGKSGGYRLTRSPEDYPVGEILRAVEGNLSPIACQSEDGSGCGASCDCDARLFWQGLEDQINSYVDNHTLAQFMRVNEKTPAVLNGTDLLKYTDCVNCFFAIVVKSLIAGQKFFFGRSENQSVVWCVLQMEVQ